MRSPKGFSSIVPRNTVSNGCALLETGMTNAFNRTGPNADRKPRRSTGLEALAAREKKEPDSRWQAENAGSIASSNSFVETNGLPLADHRLF